MRLPKHLRADRVLLSRLRKEANGLRGLYGRPVWLVGSALLDGNNNPRDWDLRIELPDSDFERRFRGSVDDWIQEGLDGKWTGVRWRWSDECVKRSKQGFSATLKLIDFQIYPSKYWRMFKRYPRLRLDTR